MNMRPQKAALYNLFKLVFMIVFVAHFCGCMFFLVGTLEADMGIAEKTWIDVNFLRSKEWYE